MTTPLAALGTPLEPTTRSTGLPVVLDASGSMKSTHTGFRRGDVIVFDRPRLRHQVQLGAKATGRSRALTAAMA